MTAIMLKLSSIADAYFPKMPAKAWSDMADMMKRKLECGFMIDLHVKNEQYYFIIGMNTLQSPVGQFLFSILPI